jgi:glycerol-3-phosphate dehydrogenase (NAD(P)+)
VLIVGYGAFGRAVHAALAHRSDVAISIYSRSPKDYLHQPVDVFDSPAAIDLSRYDVAVVALPGHAVGQVLGGLRASSPTTAFLSCVKGMDPESSRLPSEIIREATGSDYLAVMSGASFASEMLLGGPVFLTLACANIRLGRELVDRLENPVLRLELTDDVRGLEIAGVGKNIIALGAGLADGLELGENFRAAFIARGVVELRAAAERLGGLADTIVAAGALGDFFLSCSSPRSRNYLFGSNIARGVGGDGSLAEGWSSADSFLKLLHAHGVKSAYFEGIVNALTDPPLISTSLFPN